MSERSVSRALVSVDFSAWSHVTVTVHRDNARTYSCFSVGNPCVSVFRLSNGFSVVPMMNSEIPVIPCIMTTVHRGKKRMLCMLHFVVRLQWLCAPSRQYVRRARDVDKMSIAAGSRGRHCYLQGRVFRGCPVSLIGISRV